MRRFRIIEQGLDVAAQNREGCAQFVRDVRHEIPPHLVHLFQLRDIMKQNECAGNLARIVLRGDGMQLDL